MNKVNSIALLALALAMSAGGTSAAGATKLIAITNPSFEDPVTGSPGYDEAVVPTGWYNYNNAGTYSVLPGSPPTGGAAAARRRPGRLRGYAIRGTG